MYAEFSVVRDGLNNIIRMHGIGARDCEFTNFADILDKYVKQYGLPLDCDKTVFCWDKPDGYYFLVLKDAFRFRIGRKVGSTICSPVRFEDAEIIGRYLENYYPYYRVRLQNGTERICREIDLFSWF